MIRAAKKDTVKVHYTGRLEDGTSSIQAGVVFLDMLANLEKIGDHLINIAERVQVTSGQMNNGNSTS